MGVPIVKPVAALNVSAWLWKWYFSFIKRVLNSFDTWRSVHLASCLYLGLYEQLCLLVIQRSFAKSNIIDGLQEQYRKSGHLIERNCFASNRRYNKKHIYNNCYPAALWGTHVVGPSVFGAFVSHEAVDACVAAAVDYVSFHKQSYPMSKSI